MVVSLPRSGEANYNRPSASIGIALGPNDAPTTEWNNAVAEASNALLDGSPARTKPGAPVRLAQVAVPVPGGGLPLPLSPATIPGSNDNKAATDPIANFLSKGIADKDTVSRRTQYLREELQNGHIWTFFGTLWHLKPFPKEVDFPPNVSLNASAKPPSDSPKSDDGGNEEAESKGAKVPGQPADPPARLSESPESAAAEAVATKALSAAEKKKLGGLAGRAGERVGDVIRDRGGTGVNVRQAGPWADKTLGEAAAAAVKGDSTAETAIKIAKQARRLGQRH
jgi:hypothetical protein